jgi:hypothetical protein
MLCCAGLPVEVRDKAMGLEDNIPKAEVNREYYAQNQEALVCDAAHLNQAARKNLYCLVGFTARPARRPAVARACEGLQFLVASLRSLAWAAHEGKAHRCASLRRWRAATLGSWRWATAARQTLRCCSGSPGRLHTTRYVHRVAI